MYRFINNYMNVGNARESHVIKRIGLTLFFLKKRTYKIGDLYMLVGSNSNREGLVGVGVWQSREAAKRGSKLRRTPTRDESSASIKAAGGGEWRVDGKRV